LWLFHIKRSKNLPYWSPWAMYVVNVASIYLGDTGDNQSMKDVLFPFVKKNFPDGYASVTSSELKYQEYDEGVPAVASGIGPATLSKIAYWLSVLSTAGLSNLA
jgi:hypothetical protein